MSILQYKNADVEVCAKHHLVESLIRLFKSKLIIDITIDAIIAVPNPSITKVDPIRPCVIINVTALMTNRNSPSVTTVIGNVKITRIGFTITFNIDKIKLAINAGPKPSNVNESNNCATAISAIALRNIDKNQRSSINAPPVHSE